MITFLDHISANTKERGPERKCLRNILVAGKSQSETKNMPMSPKRRVTRSNHIQNRLLKKRAWRGFPGGAVVKNLPANAGDMGSSPGLGRSHMPRSN